MDGSRVSGTSAKATGRRKAGTDRVQLRDTSLRSVQIDSAVTEPPLNYFAAGTYDFRARVFSARGVRV